MIAKINADKYAILAAKYEIEYVPTHFIIVSLLLKRELFCSIRYAQIGTLLQFLFNQSVKFHKKLGIDVGKL